MQAWAQDRYGTAEVIHRVSLPVPTPAKGQVLVQVKAVGLNAGDRHLMRGLPYLVRLAFGLRRPRQPVRGMDVAGTVTGVGAEVEQSWLGAEVVGEFPSGGLAEYAVAPAKRLGKRPTDVDVVTAASLPVAAGTAWQALELAKVEAGARVLILGATGGVGTFAVQLVGARRGEVWATCGADNRALVEGLGAARTFDYRDTSLADLPAARLRRSHRGVRGVSAARPSPPGP